MRYHRFFVDTPLAQVRTCTLREDDIVHQLRSVLRLTVGSQIILCDGSGKEYTAFITSLSSREVVCEILAVHEPDERLRHLTLVVALIKKDKFEWVLEKGTELGVTRFIPLLASRSEKKSFSEERGLKIIREAAEQSGKVFLPQLSHMGVLEDVIRETEGHERYCLDLDAPLLPSLYRERTTPLLLFIGP